MIKTTCPLCKSAETLVRSHSIPKWMFRPALEPKKGPDLRLVTLGGDEHAPLDLDDSQGKAHLLCQGCEDTLNRQYDQKACSWWQNASPKISDLQEVELELDVLIGFTASVLWRASNSSARFYSGFQLTTLQCDLLREMFSDNRPLADKTGLRIAKLIDSAGHMDSNTFFEVLAVAESGKHHEILNLQMLGGGLMWELVYPRPENSNRWSEEFLDGKNSPKFLGQSDFATDARLIGLGVDAKHKRENGCYSRSFAKRYGIAESK